MKWKRVPTAGWNQIDPRFKKGILCWVIAERHYIYGPILMFHEANADVYEYNRRIDFVANPKSVKIAKNAKIKCLFPKRKK